MNWVKVSDRLPEEGKGVLVLYKTEYSNNLSAICIHTNGGLVPIDDDDSEEENPTLGEGFFEQCEQHDSYYDNIYLKRDVTHWQPLPEPPKD